MKVWIKISSLVLMAIFVLIPFSTLSADPRNQPFPDIPPPSGRLPVCSDEVPSCRIKTSITYYCGWGIGTRYNSGFDNWVLRCGYGLGANRGRNVGPTVVRSCYNPQTDGPPINTIIFIGPEECQIEGQECGLKAVEFSSPMFYANCVERNTGRPRCLGERCLRDEDHIHSIFGGDGAGH